MYITYQRTSHTLYILMKFYTFDNDHDVPFCSKLFIAYQATCIIVVTTFCFLAYFISVTSSLRWYISKCEIDKLSYIKNTHECLIHDDKNIYIYKFLNSKYELLVK